MTQPKPPAEGPRPCTVCGVVIVKRGDEYVELATGRNH